MKIIIPMAGHSRRFKEAGYNVPKVFIDIDGKPMIAHVCHTFSPSDDYIFICNKEHLTNIEFRSILESVVPKYQIVGIEPHEFGPVYSILQAKESKIDDDEPIIVSYCDITMQWNYRQFLNNVSLYEGGIAVFEGFHPASLKDTYFGYLRENGNMEMIEIREKQPFTDNRLNEYASSGVYYYESWKTFLKYANMMVSQEDKVRSEYYCSMLFNYMVRDGKKVILFKEEKFISFGTPEDLREYQFWSEYFAKDVRQIRHLQKGKYSSTENEDIRPIKEVASGEIISKITALKM